MRRSSLAVLVLSVLLPSCCSAYARAGSTPIATPVTPSVEVTIRAGSDAFTNGCSADGAAATIVGFLDAFNRGDQAALAGHFPTEDADYPGEAGPFNWYSVGGPGGISIFTHADLLPYFAERHLQGERMRLLELSVATSWHEGVDVTYSIFREADDIRPGERIGKGALTCRPWAIFVWSMGDLRPDDATRTRRATPAAG